MATAIWWALLIGALPLLGWLLWWWNDIWYGLITATPWSSKRGTKLPPGRMGLPIIGELMTFLWYFKFLRQPDDYINSKRHKYGDGIGMYRTHLFGTPSVIAITSTVTKFVLRDDESFILNCPNIEVVGKNSMAAAHGKTHARLRTFVSSSINQPDALRQIALTMQPQMISSLQSWTERGRITSFKEIMKVTFDNLGMYFASFESGPTLDKLDEYLHGLIRGFRAYPLNIPGSTLYKALLCRRKALAILREELEKRRNNSDGRTKPMNDLMDGLMKLKDEEGSQLSDIEIVDNIVSLLLGGHQTVSLSMMWAIYYLAKYPKVLQKLRDENMSLKNSKNQQLVTSDEILSLKYTMKVVNETIRIANIVAFIIRRTTKDINYEGYTIPKGWNIILWLRYVNNDAENFDDPMSFNPDRWDASKTSRNFQGFGYGPRNCAGNMFARLQIALFLHHLSTGYKWELVNPDAKVKYLPYPKPEDDVEITIRKL